MALSLPSSFLNSLTFIALWNVKEPTHYSKRVGREVPGVMAVLCALYSLQQGGRLGVCLKRLRVYEATYEAAKTALSQYTFVECWKH